MTIQCVFKVEGKNAAALKTALDADPFNDDSFVKAGYTLKESSAVGLPAGFQLVHFKTEEDAVAAKLKERLKAVPSAEEVSGADKDKVIATIEEEQNQAAAGFGSIFG